MLCPACATDNRVGRRFCAGCGAYLLGTCTRCGFSNEPGERFCGGCGLDLSPETKAAPAPAPAPPAAAPVAGPERRHLTVMFADLVGSTAMSTRLDPEDLREVVLAYQGAAAAAVARFGGFVARYSGDGILVYFGYPRAHEDDAERAVRSGLAVVEATRALGATVGRRWNVELRVRVGIATGLVIVGDLVGEGASSESPVVGETPNLAARLQALATPDTVVVGETTRHLVRRAFDLEDLGAHELKGIDGPTRAWRVLGEAHAAAGEGAGAATPLVGRDDDLGLLVGAWRRAREGDGAIVGLVGEAGIGKSRLVRALRDQLAGEPHLCVAWQCSAYHDSSALWPVARWFEREARLDRGDGAAERLAKVEAAVKAAGMAPMEAVAPFAALLDLPPGPGHVPLEADPALRTRRTREAILGYLAALARRQPLLVVIEDLHWADPTTLQLVDALLDRIPKLPALALLTHRPDGQAPWVGRPGVRLLALERLHRSQAAALVRGMCASVDLPAALLERILERTEGVPLFLEELTAAVLDSEWQDGGGPNATPALPIPATLQESLLARIDRLGDAKAIAQVGAAIGREFPRALLAEVAGVGEAALAESIDRLVRSQLAYLRGTAPQDSVVFKHAMVQEVAYGTLLRGRRRELHERIGRALEARFPDVVEAEPETVAHHYAEAGLCARAVDLFRRAGSRAAASGASVEAIAHFERALRVTASLERGAERDQLELALRLGLAASCRLIDRYHEALAALEPAEALARAHPAPAALADVHHLRGNVYFSLGRLDGCLVEHGKALSRAREAALPAAEARALGGLGDAYYLRGCMRTASRHFREGIEVSCARGEGSIEASIRTMAGWCAYWCGNLREALDEAAAGLRLAVEAGDRRAEMIARAAVGLIQSESGAAAVGRGEIERSVELARWIGTPRFEAGSLYYLSRSTRVLGEREETRRLCTEALAIARRTGMAFAGPGLLGTLATLTQDPAERRALLEEGEAILADDVISHSAFWFRRHAIDAALAEGDASGAERHAKALETFLAERESTPRLESWISLGRLLARHLRREPVADPLCALRESMERGGFVADLATIDDVLAGRRA